MKQIFIYIAFAVLFVQQSVAQNITLDFCREKARANYPLLKQYDLIDKTAVFNISNANKAYLPQFSVGIKASYQSDVTEIPESLGQVISQMSGQPFSFPSMSKDQYQAARCPLLGYELNYLTIEGAKIPSRFLQVYKQAEVEKAGYDAGASKLYDFFKAELAQYLTPELNPKGREIIEACLRGASVEEYESLISRD